MLEIFDQNPQSRVFHVDRECYVVYLGSHWEDFKPFLRLGTSPELPPELPPIVSTIVVPDALTGNPLDEPACLAGDATPDTHYVGDLETVEHMKSFVGQHTIPVEAIEAIDHEDDDGKHVLVYYYKDGNLKIKFRRNEIFDLRRREKLDGHFIARAQDAKNEYGRGPFKFPGDAYQLPGFIVLRGAPYLVARGELAALHLTDDYFFALSAAGIDADRVSTVQAEEADAALIRFFKRSRTRNRLVRISSPRGERVRQASDLFPANSLPPLKTIVLEGHGGVFDFHKFRVTRASGRFEASLDGLDGPIVFGSAAKKTRDGSYVVDATAGSLLFVRSKTSHPLVEGTLYQFGGVPTNDDASRFLPEKNYPYRDLLSQAENTLLAQLEYFFNELFGGRDTAKVIRTLKGLDPVKAIGRDDGSIHPIVEVVLHNYKEYARYVRDHEAEVGRGAEALLGLLDRHQVGRADAPANLPLVGEICRDGEREYLFYRFAARITGDRYAHAEQVAAKVYALPAVDFAAERQRLVDLIAGLATPEQMDEARLRRIAAAGKKKAADRRAGESEKEGAGGSEQDAHGRGDGTTPAGARERGGKAAPRGRAAGGRGAGTRRRTGRRRWVLPTAVLLVLIAALLALLLTGTIPSPWFDPVEPAAVTDDPTVPMPDPDVVDPDLRDPDVDPDVTDPDLVDPDAVVPDAVDPDVEPRLPDGWPEESLPAIQALEQTPGVTITETSVIGPGGIEITLRDIIDLVNRIATDNGYAPMGVIDPDRPDPDWIYPGNLFVLPDGTRYTVVQGDTLWHITVRYMVARLRSDYDRYTRLVAEYEDEATGEARRTEIVELLAALGAASHTENFTRLVEETLDRWEE